MGDGWRLRALCRTRPADWWDLGDDGNRLAMLLCQRACPVQRACEAADPNPCGVVRAGTAWHDTGDKAAICGCGRPVVPARVASTMCWTCDPAQPIPPTRRFATRVAAGAVEAHADTIADLAGKHWSDRAIGARLGFSTSGVRSVRYKYDIPAGCR